MGKDSIMLETRSTIMEAERVLDRALIFLEFDKFAEGEGALREAVKLAGEQDDVQTLVSAMACLGDFLYSIGRDEEAKSWIEKVWAHRDDRENFPDEIDMAEEFLIEWGEIEPGGEEE
jgi:hypothetical protein